MSTRRVFAPPLLIALASLIRLRGGDISIQRLAAGLPGGVSRPTAEDCLHAARLRAHTRTTTEDAENLRTAFPTSLRRK